MPELTVDEAKKYVAQDWSTVYKIMKDWGKEGYNRFHLQILRYGGDKELYFIIPEESKLDRERTRELAIKIMEEKGLLETLGKKIN